MNSVHFDIELTNGFGDVIQGHRAVFLSRSDYFGALFTDHFHESDETNEFFGKFRLPNVSENGLIALKSYCYTEAFPEGLEEIDLIEVLEMSDYYMLPGMKKVITSYMLNYLQNHNVLDWLLRGKICYLNSAIIVVIHINSSSFVQYWTIRRTVSMAHCIQL